MEPRPASAEVGVERSLDRLRLMHESILRSAGEGIFGLDLDGHATFANEAAAQMVGWDVDELIGHRMHDVVHHARPDGSAYPLEQCPIRAALVDGAVHKVSDEVFWRRDGSSFPVEYTATPIVEDGRVSGAVVVFTDITTRLAAEGELRASEARNRAMAEEQAALRRVATAVAADAESEEIFDLVAREVAALVGAEAGRVVRFAEAEEHGGALARVRDHRRSAVWWSDEGDRVEIAAPIWLGTTLWGAILAVAPQDGVSEGAEGRLAAFAQLVGMAIANAESRDRIVTEAIASILQGRLDMDATLGAIAEAAKRALGSDRATCYVNDEEATTVVAVHTTTADPAERAFLEKTMGRSAARMPIWRMLVDEPEPLLVVEDVRCDGRVAPALAARLGSGAIIGVRLEHSSVAVDGAPVLLGTLFMSYREPRRFSARALTTARGLAGLAALSIANARLHGHTLKSLASAELRASIDPLTGLANHRTFHERLREEVARALRDKRPLSLALFDLDHFKQVNDAHGHQIGDRTLVEVAERLNRLAREEDLIARIGGEEFAWILPGADGAEAAGAAERARSAMVEQPFSVGELSVSAGVCDASYAGGDAMTLVELADGALYWAKAHGRNVVCRYSPEVVTDLSAQGRVDRLTRTQAMSALRALAQAVDAKDHSTQRHSERVAGIAVQLARASGWPAARVSQLREAGLLHDVGKIGVPDAVLFKPGRLTPEEYEQVKLHSPLGARIAAEVLSLEQVAWIRHHHERWDGGGYPDGLVGADAPDGARLLALADAWDVMTSARVYKAPISVSEALAECRLHAGSQFAHHAVEALGYLVDEGLIGSPGVAAEAVAAERDHEPSILRPLRDFRELCHDAVHELQRAMGWELVFLARVRGEILEMIAVAGDPELLAAGTKVPFRTTLCHRMLAGAVPQACGELSRPDSGYFDVTGRVAFGLESYSGHPVIGPDGSVFGTLCAIDRRPREIDEEGRRLGAVLARLLAWELQRGEGGLLPDGQAAGR